MDTKNLNPFEARRLVQLMMKTELGQLMELKLIQIILGRTAWSVDPATTIHTIGILYHLVSLDRTYSLQTRASAAELYLETQYVAARDNPDPNFSEWMVNNYHKFSKELDRDVHHKICKKFDCCHLPA